MKDMLEKIEQIEKKYIELGETLSDPAVIQDYNRFRDLSKQRKSMEETVETYYAWKKAVDTIAETKELMIAKNHDYDEAWRSMRVHSYTDLILMKILRTKQIEDNNGETLVSEGIDANYKDMINYSIFAIIKLTEK